MKKIILTTLNARYSHTSLGLRYLFANLAELQADTQIMEFVINGNNQNIAEELLQQKPAIIGFGVYIWNAKDTASIVKLIKQIAPHIIVVLGGPEVSYTPLRVDFMSANYIIAGEGEEQFRDLCRSIFAGNMPLKKYLGSQKVSFQEICLPYKFYTDEDIKYRNIYVELSRGCPFECEFCLSSLEQTVRYLEIDIFFQEIESLWQRGARNFRFIDRTFNLHIGYGSKVLEYFANKTGDFFVHFEVIPDNFPTKLRELIMRFRPNTLQLEVGVQTLDKEVARNIKRNLNIEKIQDNLRFLNKTHAHLHLDLIIGLPGESIEGFGKNLDTLITLANCEIQVGILKKLAGTSMDRHDKQYGFIYNEEPPYEILQNNLISFEMMQHMKRFSRYWDLVYNSGNFKNLFVHLLGDGRIFQSFSDFTAFIYATTRATHKISPERMAKMILSFLEQKKELDFKALENAYLLDLDCIKRKSHQNKKRQIGWSTK